MMYDEYEAKIIRLAEIKTKIMRFKWLYLIIIILSAIATITCLALKGVVIEPLMVDSQITYGEEIKISGGKAIFSDSYYEYRPVSDSNWTQEKPTLVGDYEVRMVTQKLFGPSYSQPLAFSILPKEINFTLADNFTYGDKPQIETELLAGDYLVEDNLRFNYEEYLLPQIKVSLDLTSVKIVNQVGEDVTSCYKLPSNYEFLVSPEPLKITLKANDVVKTYDGISLLDRSITLDNASLEKLYDNDVITSYAVKYDVIYTIATSVTPHATYDMLDVVDPLNVGEYAINISDAKVMRGNIDVTALYDFTYEYAKLTINKREITIKSAKDSKVYDGKIFNTVLDYTIISGSLAANDIISISSRVSGKDVGQYVNEIFANMFRNGQDVTDNYLIDYVFDFVEITPKPMVINLDLSQNNLVYNGLDQQDNLILNFSSTDLVPGDSLTVSSVELEYRLADEIVPGLIDAGEYLITPVSAIYSINDGKGQKNYHVTYSSAALTIDKARVTVELAVKDRIYSGDAFVLGKDDYLVSGLCQNDEISLEVNYLSNIVNVGTYDVICTAANITVGKPSNYDITIINDKDTFNILPYQLTLNISQTLNKVYDGYSYTLTEEDWNLTADNEVYHNKLLANDTIAISFSFNDLPEAIVAGTYLVTGEIEFTSGEATNYAITSQTGYLVIAKRPVSIKPVDMEQLYEGKEIAPINEYEIVDGNLVKDDQIKIVVKPTGAINVGTYPLEIAEVIYLNETGKNNYDFTYLPGELKIIPRNIIYEFGQIDDITYDGYNHLISAPYMETELSDGFVAGEGVIMNYHYYDSDYNKTTTIINVGQYLVELVVSDFVNTLADNYIINLPNALAFNITKRPLTLSLLEVEPLTYNASYYNYPDYENYVLEDGTSLAINDIVRLIVQDEDIFDVGSYTISIIDVEFITGLASNYAIDFKIKEREVIIKPKDLTINFYQSNPISYNGEIHHLSYDISGLVGSDILNITDLTYEDSQTGLSLKEPINSGTYLLTDFTYDIYNSEYNKDIPLKNYNLTLLNVEPTLIITPRIVNITAMELPNLTYGSSSYHDFVDSSGQINDYILLGEDDFIDPVTITYSYYSQATSTTKIDPINVGTYYYTLEVAVENSYNYQINIFNNNKEKYFKILAAEIVISLTAELNKTYDGLAYTYPGAFSIVNETTVHSYDIHFELAYYLADNTSINTTPIAAGTYQVALASYQVMASDGANYVVLLDKEYELVIVPKDVTLKPIDVEKVYDDAVFTYNPSSYIVDGLCAQDSIVTIEVIYLQDNIQVEPLHVGEYVLRINNFSLNGNKNNYNFILEDAKLTIKQKPIEIVLKPLAAETYNGFDLNPVPNYVAYDAENLRYELPTSLSFVITKIVSGNVVRKELLLAGDYTLTYMITNLAELSDYHITLANERLDFTINKLPITIGIANLNPNQKVFDGKATNLKIDPIILAGSLATRDAGKINLGYDIYCLGEKVTTIYDVGLYTIKINSQTNIANEDNYIVTLAEDVITYEVLARPINITIPNQSKIYDGRVFSPMTWENVVIDDLLFSSNVIISTDEYVNAGLYEANISYDILGYDINNFIINGPKTINLEILPKTLNITLNNQEKIYDKEIIAPIWTSDFTTSDLIKGQIVEVMVNYFNSNGEEVSPIMAGTYTINCYDITLDGDLKSNYAIVSNGATLIINQRKVNLSLDTSNLVLWYNKEERQIAILTDGVLPGDDLELNRTIYLNGEVVSSAKNAGYYLITVEIGNPNYYTDNNSFDFNILPYSLEISTSSLVAVYDGSSHASLDFTITSQLANLLTTNDLEIVGSYPQVKYVEDGIVENRYEVMVKADLASNYEITYQYGNISISPKDLYINTNSATKIYDGKPLIATIAENTNFGLAANDKLTYKGTSLILVGSVAADVEITILNANNDDITKSYHIIKAQIGTLTITPLTLEFEVSASYLTSYKTPLDELSKAVLQPTNLVTGDTISASWIKDGKPFTSIDMVGSYSITLADIRIMQGKNDVSYCYIIPSLDTYVLALEVRPCEITLTTEGYTFIPSLSNLGPYSYPNFTSNDIINQNGDYLVVDSNILTLIHIGEEPKENILKALIYNKQNEDVTNCYDIKYEYGSLEVNNEINYTFNKYEVGYSFVYRGTPYTLTDILPGYDIRDNKLYLAAHSVEDNSQIEGVNYVFTFNQTSFINQGTYNLKITKLGLVSETDQTLDNIFEDNSDDEIDIKITIVPKEIYIKAKDYTKKYDAMPYYIGPTDYEMVEMPNKEADFVNSLVAGDYLEILSSNCDGTSNAGVKQIIITGYRIYNELGDVTSNYKVITEASTVEEKGAFIAILVIEWLTVEASSGSGTFTYDGNFHYVNEGTIISGLLKDISSYDISVVENGFGFKIVSTIPNMVKFKIVDKETGEDVSKNYLVNYSGAQIGTITILPKTLTIQVANLEFNYDGTNKLTNLTFKADGLITGDSIKYDDLKIVCWQDGQIVTEAINPGSYTITLEGNVIINDIPVAINYDVVFITGTLIIENNSDSTIVSESLNEKRSR